VKRGCIVTVDVDKSYDFEDLTLDWKSTATVIPPDTYQTIYSALSPNFGKLTLMNKVINLAPRSDVKIPPGNVKQPTISFPHNSVSKN
jgi:hypothetical protein